MDPVVYAALKDAERSWWYQGRKSAVRAHLNKVNISKGSVLDLGAGFGAMHSLLAEYGPVTAYEVSSACLEACRDRGYAKVIGNKEELFAQEKPYSLVGAFDVIEHIEDDVGFLSKLRRDMTQDGYLVATVPAFQCLWSEHDVANHHFRRYNKKSLSSLLQTAGFEIERISYWNSLLFFPAALMRLFGFAGKEALSPKPIVNRLLSGVVYFESKIQSFFPLPVGLSLVVLAKRGITASID